MKTLVVAPQPFFTARGTPLSVYYRSLVMAEQGAEIDLLTYGSGMNVRIPGVRIVRVPRLAFLEPLPIGPSWAKVLLDVFMIFATMGLLIRHRYRVVHAHEEGVFWCRFLKPIFRFRLIYDMHSSLPQQLENFGFTRSPLLIGLFRILEGSCVKAADAIVTVCPDLTSYAVGLGADPSRVMLIENAMIDEVRLADSDTNEAPDMARPQVDFPAGNPTILYAGTFEAYQGVDVLIRAFSRVVTRRPDARLLLVGGNDRQVTGMRELADSLGLSGSCLFTGHVSRKAAIAFAKAAQVLVSLRLRGGNTPLKIYELLASGRPMVATRVWAHTQILDDDVCFLVEPDPDSMAEGLLVALNDERETARRIANALARFERDYTRRAYEQKIRHLLTLVA